MLTGGFYAEVELEYDAAIAAGGERPAVPRSRASGRSSCRRATRSTTLARGRERLHDRAVEALPAAQRRLRAGALLSSARRTSCSCGWSRSSCATTTWSSSGRAAPGKSHLFQQVSPYAHLVSGGKATVAKMFVNNATGQRGLVAQYDVVCFDEVSGVSFDQKDGVNILKGYMESGEFSRGGRASAPTAASSWSATSTSTSSTSSGSATSSGRCRRRCATTPRSWIASTPTSRAGTSRSSNPALFTEHFGLVSDFLAECWSQLRTQSRARPRSQGRVLLRRRAERSRHQRRQQDGRRAAQAALSRTPRCRSPDEDLEWAVRLALECRRRVKEQQKRIGSAEFRNTHFSYRIGEDGVEQFVATPELQSDDAIGADPLPPGQVWAISPGGADEGVGPLPDRGQRGAGLGRQDHQPARRRRRSARASSAPSRTSTRGRASSSATATRGSTSSPSAARLRRAEERRRDLGVPALLALCGALLEKSLTGGLIAVGGAQPRRRHRPDLQRRRRRRARGREGRDDAADARLRPPAAQRPLRRDGDEAHRPLLRRRQRRLG